MNGMASRFVRYGVGLLGLVILGWVLTGQAAKPTQQGFPLPTDWSHQHLIFSQPGTTARARLVGNELRYWLQFERLRQRVLVRSELSGASALASFRRARATQNTPTMHRDWSEDLGSGGSVGPGNYPAKFSFSSTVADCVNDYVAFSTGLPGVVNQASIVAFNNLYSGCGGTVPSVLWAYNTSQLADTAAVMTSPALSLDGTQLAFVQTDGANAQLVLLKWAANSLQSVTSPGIPTHVLPALYRLCVAPCMTSINLTNLSNANTDDTTSSVFIDYSGDEAWVGDSGGSLHQFSGVFRGTPAEVRGGTWPVAVSTGPLSSPVLDHVSGNVFAAGATDGFLYRVSRSTAAVTASGRLDFGVGIVAGPLVDSGNGTVYVSASSDGSAACAGAPCSAVYKMGANFTGGTTGSKVVVGTSSATPQPMYDGFFDSAYLNSVNGTGNFYVCGNTGLTPTLYQVPIAAGTFGTPITVSVLTRTLNRPCSPVTDFANPNTTGGASERVFVGVRGDGWPNICIAAPPGGCIMNFVVTQWKPSTAYTLGQEVLVSSLANPNVLFIQTVTQAGTSGTTTPAWGAVPDITTPDPNFAGVNWLNQGRIDATPFAVWTKNKQYNVIGQRILGSNGTIQLVHAKGKAGATEPAWNTIPGTITPDGPNTLTWRNAGSSPTLALPASSGTSGIIIDNVVGSGTLAGASQIYFSTLANQACTFGGTGGCAVQASQPALQ